MDEEATNQWGRPQAMSADDGLSAEFMERIWQQGVIGMKEFRAWLAENFVSFAEVRDPSVDALIDDVARSRFERSRYPEENNTPEEPETP